jgi:2-phospho-L-lactate/phosphoenolpyruvate guanylyltransferase
MTCWAIVPVKSFALGKSRLAAILGAEQRTALNRRLFGRVLDAAQSHFSANRIVVVTADAFLLALVRGQGLHGLQDPGGGLNAALAHGANAVIVLSSDLPLVTAGDIAALTSALGEAPCCVIAPDETEQGTNALALAPPDAAFFRFGADSFQAHLAAARAGGRAVRVLRRAGLAQDLDTPENYKRFAETQPAPSGALA